MALKGDTKNLKNFSKKLATMDKTIAIEIAAKAAGTITAMAQSSYDSGASVYGGAYPGGVDLVRTGATRGYVRFSSDGGTKIRCSVNTPYARYLIRYGILPNGSAAIPVTWLAALQRISADVIGGG